MASGMSLALSAGLANLIQTMVKNPVPVCVAIGVGAIVIYFTLRPKGTTGKAETIPWKAPSEAIPFLNKKKYDRQKVTLISKESLTSDVCRFRFSLPSDSHYLGLPIGKAIKVMVPNIAHERDAEEWNPRPNRDGDSL